MLTGVLALALAGCAPVGGIDPPTTTKGAAATVLPGAGDGGAPLVVGLGGFGSPRTLNPLIDGPDTGVLDVIGAAVFASAYSVDPLTRDLVPEALAQIPSVRNGGVAPRGDGSVAVTYRLSPTARWSDGEPITAEDLRFTYEVVSDPLLPIRRDVRARYESVIPGSVSAEGLTLRLEMRDGLNAPLLFGIILPAHQVAGTDFVQDWNDRMWTAGGPFAFSSWQPGQYLQLRANPRYARRDPVDGSALPHLGAVVYRFFPDSDGSALERAFASRLVDVAVVSAGADLAAYTALEDRGAAVATAPGLSWQALVFQFGPANRNTASLNADRRFRRAVAAAVDREEIARELNAATVPTVFGTCRPGLASGAWEDTGYGPARAAGLLEELRADLGADLFAGNGPRLVLTAPVGDAGAVATSETVVTMLRSAGIAAEVQEEDGVVFHRRTMVDGTWDVAVLTFSCAPGLAPAAALAFLFDPGAQWPRGANLTRWGTVGSVVAEDAAVGEYALLLARLREAADDATAESLLRRAERILADEVVLLPLATTTTVGVAYWADAVQGVRADPLAGIAADIGMWRRTG